MPRKVTLKKVISVVRLSLLPIWSWPQPRDASKLRMFCMKLHHYLCILIELGLILPLLYSIKNNLDNPTSFVHSGLVTSSLIHTISNFIFHIVNQHHLQNVVFEMEQFSESMKPHEEVIIQRYIDQSVVFHSVSIIIFYLNPLVTIFQTYAMNMTFPSYAEYPFDVHYQPLQTIIFIQQSITGILVTGQLCTNIFMALLLWFAIAKFELLNKEMMKATNIFEVYKCIKKHQELLEYAAEVTLVTRPFAFSSICCSTVSLISTFLSFITKQPLSARIQFSTFSVACISEVYMYTWPADYLIHMCHNVARAAFNMLHKTPTHVTNIMNIWKCLQIIIMRSQKPVTISIPCILPTLSLSYFSLYCSTILSYFTTLRAMMI